MENKINIAEILKDCPKGMELNCTLYENVVFDYIEQNSELTYPIHCLMKINGGYNALVFTRNGCNDRHPNAKCVIFPKGKTTWEGFIPPCKFKDGDILFHKHKSNNIKYIFIYKRRIDKHYLLNYCGWFSEKPLVSEQFNVTERVLLYENDDIRFATEEEKEKLFEAIKDNGYKWNADTKTLEKLIKPKFKVGDRIKTICNNCQYDIKEITDTHYNLVDVEYKLKYTEPISEDKNWELVPEKFDINTLKPFDKVLVRCNSLEKWHIQFFEKYNTELDAKYPFICLCNSKYCQCVPYEGNEHLLDTTDDCDEYFKNW